MLLPAGSLTAACENRGRDDFDVSDCGLVLPFFPVIDATFFFYNKAPIYAA